MNHCLAFTQNTSAQAVVAPFNFLHWPYIAAELIISILAIFGNLLVCVAVGQKKNLRTVTNYFLVSLAIADFFVGSLAIPFAIITDLVLPLHNTYVCTVIVYMLIMLTQSSILSLLAVAVERYVYILLPFHYQRLLKPRNAGLILLIVWGLAFVLSVVPMLGWQYRSSQIRYCLYFSVVDISYLVYFHFFGCFLIPMLIMLFIYIHIFLTVREHLRRIAAVRTALEVHAREYSDLQRKAKKAASIFLLVLLFALCWMPIHILNCIELFCKHCKVPVPLLLTAIILSHANSAINPLLYTYRMKHFRFAFKSYFLSCRMIHPEPDTTESNGTSNNT